jgi:phospholipid/cholesterol/gamma-HCH transport system substrate-binding protein
MKATSITRTVTGVTLVALLVAGITVLARPVGAGRTELIGYFDNSNGLFAGDNVVVLGVPVGNVDRIEAQPRRVKITFHVNRPYQVPADAKAVIISPSLVAPRAIQLTPANTVGPVLGDQTVIPQSRTAVPMEYDDVRRELKKLVDTLQPTQPGGVSTLGAFVNTAADNLRGQGSNIRDALIKLSDAVSALGDHSTDIFGTVKNLSLLVAALHDSSDVLSRLNVNLAAVTGMLTQTPDAVSAAVADLHTAAEQVRGFLADNRDALGTTADKLAAIARAVGESLDDIKQALHIGPTSFANVVNLYSPSTGALTGAAAITNFNNPVSFLCSAIQAASRLGAEQSAKLCTQYLAPILKNRQYNFLPLGENFFVGARARPNEITYSEDWLRPSNGPNAAGPAPSAPPPAGPVPPPDAAPKPSPASPLEPPSPAAPTSTDPAAGLPGIMVAPTEAK